MFLLLFGCRRLVQRHRIPEDDRIDDGAGLGKERGDGEEADRDTTGPRQGSRDGHEPVATPVETEDQYCLPASLQIRYRNLKNKII